MLWEHKPQTSVSTVFSSSLKLHEFFHRVIETPYLTNQRAYAVFLSVFRREYVNTVLTFYIRANF